jgi:hypothetical protein
MAATGESYIEAARQLANLVNSQAVLDAISREFGVPGDALSLVLRHMRETSEHPLLAAAAEAIRSAGTRPRSLTSKPFALAQSRTSVVFSLFVAALLGFRAGRRLVPPAFRAALV